MRQQAGRLLWCILAVLIMGAMTPNVGQAQTTTRVRENTRILDFSLALSANGRIVVFVSDDPDLVAGDGNGERDVFVYDRDTETTSRVSVDPQGGDSNGASASPAISADGRYVAFHSWSSNLVAGEENGGWNIFVYDRQVGLTTRVSRDSQGRNPNGDSSNPTFSADGRYVAFHSLASNLVAGDGNGETDVFVYDRDTETTSRVSVDPQGGDSNGPSFMAALSADGRYVVFVSFASNLVAGDGNGQTDVFVYDRDTETTSRVSVDPQGGDSNGFSFEPTLSANGRFVAFWSDASNLVAVDGNNSPDVFVYDRDTQTTARVSVDLEGGDPDGGSGSPAISADGRYVAFSSWATNLTSQDWSRNFDVFMYDRQRATTTRVSVAPPGWHPHKVSFDPVLSSDGRFVAFWSWASNLAVGDANGDYDVFVRDLGHAPMGSPGVRDLDGDGTADLLWRNSSNGGVAVWQMMADSFSIRIIDRKVLVGAMIKTADFLAGVPLEWQIAGSGDVDGNGTADVIWRNMKSGVVAIWMMKGSHISSIEFPGSASNDWEIKGVGDVDGDEKVDIFWQNTTSSQVSVWRMDGSTIVSTGLFNAPPSEEKLAGIGDTNADGKADVFWFNTRTGKVTIWQMDGLSISFVGFPGTASQNWAIQSVGDIDGNGTADVVWRHRTNGVVAAWLLQGSAIASSGFFDGVPLEWGMVQLGDVDGNGTADVIWRHSISGAVAVWMMNGLSISSVEFPGSLSTDWVLAGH